MGKHVTKSWVRTTWKDAKEFDVRTEDRTCGILEAKEGDVVLMEQFSEDFPTADEQFKRNVTWCWEFLRVTQSSSERGD